LQNGEACSHYLLLVDDNCFSSAFHALICLFSTLAAIE